jgi:hypothetical protein
MGVGLESRSGSSRSRGPEEVEFIGQEFSLTGPDFIQRDSAEDICTPMTPLCPRRGRWKQSANQTGVLLIGCRKVGMVSP